MSTTQTRRPTTRKATPKGQATVTVLPTKAATKATPKAKASTTAAANAEVRPAPEGYVTRWPHAAYDLLAKTDKSAEGAAWLVRCNAHGTTTEATGTKDGDQKGRKADRALWCPACRKADAPKAKAEQVAQAIREDAAAAEADAKAAKVPQARPARRSRKAVAK